MNKSRVSMIKDNKGVSVIEMIVIIAIMAVLSTSAFVAMTYITRTDIKKESKMLYSVITSSRTSSMARSGKWIFGISQAADGDFSLRIIHASSFDESTGTLGVLTEHEVEKLGEKVNFIQVNIVQADGTETGYMDLTSISFKKNTGAVEKINDFVVTESDTGISCAYVGGHTAKSGGYADIKINVANNEKVFRLYFITGEME